jgi:hypothetical protein
MFLLLYGFLTVIMFPASIDEGWEYSTVQATRLEEPEG